MPPAAPIQMKQCSLCQESFCDLPQSGRCNECQSLKTRLYRQFAKKDCAEERRQWDSLTKEQRQVFYSQWHGQVGIDLKAAIKESMVETQTESKKETSEMQFNWLDEYELKEKYEGREEQIEHLKKNAETMMCNIRKVMLWADPEYTSTETASLDSSRERKRELSANESFKPQKKPKVEVLPKPDPGTLTDKQLAMLAAEKLSLNELLKKIEYLSHKADLPDIVDCVTKRDRDQLKLSGMKVKATVQTIDMYTESGSGNFRDLRKEICVSRQEARCCHSKLKQSVNDAEKELEPEAMAIVKDAMEAFEDADEDLQV